ncbi:MAG: glucose-6-phosphate isomerase [Candidatus Aminicenantia bacterium]
MEEKVKLNFDFFKSDNLKDKALEREEIDFWIEKGISALSSINKRRWKLGFTRLPYQGETLELISSLNLSKREWENIVVTGIGGSSLGTFALFKALKPINYNLLPYEKRKSPRLFILDNPDPELFSSVIDIIDIEKTLFLVISKSGETIETISYFYLLLKLTKSRKENFLVITTSGKGFLFEKAKSLDISIIPFPEDVPGRYSVLSVVGLLPLSLIKIDISSLIKGAREIAEYLHNKSDKENPSVISSSILVGLYEKGKKIQVIMPYSSSLYEMTLWYSQLWAESLGKRLGDSCWGQTPFPSCGALDQHSQLQLWMEGPKDKVIFFWEVEKFRENHKIPDLKFKEFQHIEGKYLSKLLRTEKKATENSLAQAGVPSMTLKIPEINPYFVGQMLYFLQLQTVIAGEILGVNPFDQPGVELGKKLTKEYMEQKNEKRRI